MCGILSILAAFLYFLGEIDCLSFSNADQKANQSERGAGPQTYYKYVSRIPDGSFFVTHAGWNRVESADRVSGAEVENGLDNTSEILLTMQNSTSPVTGLPQTSVLVKRVGYVTLALSLSKYAQCVDGGRQSRCLKNWTGDARATVDLTADFKITHFKSILMPRKTRRACVRWDLVTESWSEQGCKTSNQSAVGVTCECADTNRFGVKVEVLELRHQKLTFIVLTVATGASTLFVLATLLALIKFRRSLHKPDRRLFIQLNMTAAVLLFNVTFLSVFGQIIDLVHSEFVCKATAFLNLYFELVSVFWMLFEGLVIFGKVCLTYITISRRSASFIAGVAWILPALVVCVIQILESPGSVMLYSEAYESVRLKLAASNTAPSTAPRIRKYNFCCPHPQRNGLKLYIAVVALLFLLNIAILVWVSVVVWGKSRADAEKIYKGTNNNNSKAKVDKQQARAVVRAIFILVLMLGVPWIVSLLINLWLISLKTKTVHFVFIAIQGPALFYLYCVKNKALLQAFKRAVKNSKEKKSLGSSRQSDDSRLNKSW